MLLTHGKIFANILQSSQKGKQQIFSFIKPSFRHLSTLDHLQTNVNSGTNITIKKNLDSGIAIISFSSQTIFDGSLLKSIFSLHGWREGKGLILNTDFNLKNNRRISEIINEEDFQKTLHNLHGLVDCIRMLPLITVCLLNGKVSGIGTDLFLSTDLRIVTPNSEIGLDYLRSGLPPLGGGLRFLKDLVGERECLTLVLRRRKLSSEEAVDLGVADEIVRSEGETRRGWSTEKRVKLAENWLHDLLGQNSENASIVQAVKRILVSTRVGSRGTGRKCDVDSHEILTCLHAQPHLTAMGVDSEPMLDNIPQHQTVPIIISTDDINH